MRVCRPVCTQRTPSCPRACFCPPTLSCPLAPCLSHQYQGPCAKPMPFWDLAQLLEAGEKLEPRAGDQTWVSAEGRAALSRGHHGLGPPTGPWPSRVNPLPPGVGGVAADCGPAWEIGQPDIPSRCQSGNRKQLVWVSINK